MIHVQPIHTKYFNLNPQVDSPPFAATVVAAAAIQYYQEDPVLQSLGLNALFPCFQSTIAFCGLSVTAFNIKKKSVFLIVRHITHGTSNLMSSITL